MKESEFIELLNLYVDHEITPDEAARLEAEVASNPARRRVYHQYCMMHKACSLLAGTFQESMLETRRAPARSRGMSWSTAFWIGGLATAACFAFVVALRVRTSAAASELSGSVARVSGSPAVAPSLLSAPVGNDLQPVVLMRSLSLNAGNGAVRPLFAAPVPNDSLSWMNRVQFAPLPRISQIPLAASSSLSESDSRLAAGAADGSAQVENVSFKFQR